MKRIITLLVVTVFSVAISQAEEPCKSKAAACSTKAASCDAKAQALKTGKANSSIKGAQQLVKR